LLIMGKKVNPNIIRVPKYKTWPYLWHSSYNYTSVLLQDIFIRKYLRHHFRQYKTIVASCVIKRSLTRLFIHVFLFNLNYSLNYQFKPYMFIRSYKLFRTLLDVDVPRLSYNISKMYNVGKVHFFFKFIKGQKPNFLTVALTADPVILGTYFVRKYTHMYAFKHILKTFKGLYGSLVQANFNLKGLRVQVSGPVGAPRNRMSKRIVKNFFGTTPLQTFCSLIAYSVKTRSLSEGVVTAKFWLYKKFPLADLINNKRLFLLVKNMLRTRRLKRPHFLRRLKQSTFVPRKAIKDNQSEIAISEIRNQPSYITSRKAIKKWRKVWRVKNAKTTKLYKPWSEYPGVPFCFYYDVF